jgi:hypothetical protein
MGSTRPNLPGVTEIFSEYVRKRQNGSSQQDALNFLRPVLQRLRADARQQLVALLRSWEAREGSKYKPQQKETAFVGADDLLSSEQQEDLSWLPNEDTGEVPEQQLNVNSPVHPSVEASDPVRLPDQQVFYCPSCGRANRLGDAYCFSCGTLLNVTSPQTRNLERADEDLAQVGQAHFGKGSILLLHVQGAERPIALKMHQRPEVILGRTSNATDSRPEVDLSPFKAAEMGVSRAHARLRYQDDSVTVTDLGSVNHTYINGQQLHAQEVRVLRDGDEIRLGRLMMRVTFQHAVRKLQ